MEMIMATLLAGYRMAEVPTHERPRAAGYSKISLHLEHLGLLHGWRFIGELGPSTQSACARVAPVRAGA